MKVIGPTPARQAATQADAASEAAALAVRLISPTPKPGAATDAATAAALGVDPAPAYHLESAACLAAIAAAGQVAYLLPVIVAGKEARQACCITDGGGWAVSPAYLDDATALACALHYVACVSQSALT
jgi:hypothetical protein